MGREIRRVSSNWEHPKDYRGHHIPMHDTDYEAKAHEWLQGLLAWENGTDNDRDEASCRYYWDWSGPPPNEESYRPKWSEQERTHFQIYETVSEGTPVSPIFADKQSLVLWLIKNGHSEKAARQFAEEESVCSMVAITGGPNRGIYMGIDQLDIPSEKETP